MTLVLAYDDAKVNQERRDKPGQGLTKTPFFGGREDANSPHASLNQHDKGYCIHPHFHIVDQFQVIVEGGGTLGRHELTPNCVHFTRAHTPYGPITARAEDGLGFFVMRAHRDIGGQRVPKELDQLKAVPNRQPWQISSRAAFPVLQAGKTAPDVMLQEVPGIKDEQGLAAYTFSMKPNAKASAPDPSHGDGQYLVLLKGSLFHDNKEHKACALIFVYPNEGSFQLHAGAQGLEGLVLNFPQVRPRAASIATPSAAAGFKKWQCTLCSFAYDEALGLPGDGIPAGTRWQDVPDSWVCPDCSSSKSDFQMVEV